MNPFVEIRSGEVRSRTLLVLAFAAAAAMTLTFAPAGFSAEPSPEKPQGKKERPLTDVKPLDPSKDVAVQAPSPGDLKSLNSINKKFAQASSIAMDVKKSLHLNLLNQDRQTSGRLTLSKGRMRMEMESSDKTDKSLIVINKKTIWVVTYPAPEFKTAPLQVIKADVDTHKGRAQSFIGLLARGALLEHFLVSGVQSGASEKTYFLQPKDPSEDFKRAQIRTSEKGDLRELHYWDSIGNETVMAVSNVVVGAKAPDKLFQFDPPADAEVTVY